MDPLVFSGVILCIAILATGARILKMNLPLKIKFDRFEHQPVTYYLGEGGDDYNDGLTYKTRKETLRHLEGFMMKGDWVFLSGRVRECLKPEVSNSTFSAIYTAEDLWRRGP